MIGEIEENEGGGEIFPMLFPEPILNYFNQNNPLINEDNLNSLIITQLITLIP